MSDPEVALRDVIERSYVAFGGIPAPRKLQASPLRDADAILRTLTSAPLRKLKGEQIGPYAFWAMRTVGDGRDYRHFLPRIFELSATDPSWPGAEPPVMASRLNLAMWRSWPEEQKRVVWDFFHAAFRAAASTHPDEGRSAQDWLCALLTLGQPAQQSFAMWRGSVGPNPVLQMASFISHAAKDLVRHGEVRIGFWKDLGQDVRQEVAKLLTSEETADFLRAAASDVSDEDRFYLIDAALADLHQQF